jgi:hypothetical protein
MKNEARHVKKNIAASDVVSSFQLSSVLFADISTAIPLLGPLLAKPYIEWWCLAAVLLFGIPVRETEFEPEVDAQGRPVLDADGRQVRRMVQRWRSRGLVAAMWVGATGHARLADRVGALEGGVETLREGLSAVVFELRAWRTALEARGLTAPAPRADGTSVAPPSVESPAQSRRGITSRPQ